MTDQKFLGPLHLEVGAHERGQGMCAMEAAAYLAGERHSDHPECVSPVLAAFLRSWNDGLPDTDRQKLKPWVVKVLHTNTGPADEETRAWLVTDWLARVQAPAWLDLAGLTDHAQKLRALPPLTCTEVAVACQSVLAAAWAAAWAAAGAAAWAAARAAARDAAWDAAWAAAGAAAGAALAPTVAQLQASAFELLDRMIAVGQPVERSVREPVQRVEVA